MERTFLDLSIERHPETGNWNLKQEAGPCDDMGEHWIIMAPEHLDTLARMAGYMPAEELGRACERERERLALLAAMVKAHTKDGDPLRMAAALLLSGAEQATADDSPCRPVACNLVDDRQLSLV